MTNSYNGWPASTDKHAIGVVDFTAAGHSFPGGVKGGDVETVLRYVVEQWDTRVETLGEGSGDEWGYSYRKNRNANNLSCHSSGTAVDCNASEHPNGKRRTLSDKQVGVLHRILAEVDHVIRWGGDFHGTPDEMHLEVNATPAAVKKVADRLRAAAAPAAAKPPQKAPKEIAARPTPKWWTTTLHLHDVGQEVASACKVLKLPARVTLDQDLANRLGYLQKHNGLVVTYALDEATAKVIGG